MQNVIFIAVAGALGALSRWSVGLLSARFFPDVPLGTLIVNVVGSFLLAFGLEWLTEARVSPELRTALTTGFLGAFTTFSTFSAETLKLADQGQPIQAGVNVLANVILGLLAAYAGLSLARSL